MEKLKIERKQKINSRFFFLTANKFTKSINLFYIKRQASANWQLSQQGVIFKKLRPRDVEVVKDEEGDLRKRQKAKRKIKIKSGLKSGSNSEKKTKKVRPCLGYRSLFTPPSMSLLCQFSRGSHI